MQAKAAPALVIFKTYDDPIVVYDGKFEGSAIKAFIEDKTAPILVEMDQCAPASVPPCPTPQGLMTLHPLLLIHSCIHTEIY